MQYIEIFASTNHLHHFYFCSDFNLIRLTLQSLSNFIIKFGTNLIVMNSLSSVKRLPVTFQILKIFNSFHSS